jgi:hypothetical protein
MEYSINRLSYYELPPEKRAALDQQQQKNQRYVELMNENQSLKTAREQFELQQLDNSLQQALNVPNVASVGRQIDERAGQPGLFRSLVIAHAKELHTLTGRDPSAEEAVASYLKLHGFGQGQSQGPAQQQAAQAAQAHGGVKPATLPNLKGSGTSPVRSTVRSIEDLKKLRDKL